MIPVNTASEKGATPRSRVASMVIPCPDALAKGNLPQVLGTVSKHLMLQRGNEAGSFEVLSTLYKDYLRDSNRQKVLEYVENEFILGQEYKGPGEVFGKRVHLTGLDLRDGKIAVCVVCSIARHIWRMLIIDKESGETEIIGYFVVYVDDILIL